ncbi:MAG: DUF6790 family protein [Gammaproteobacteria bacterium]
MQLYNWIPLILMNFGPVMFIVAVIFILMHSIFKKPETSKYDLIYRWIAFFALGFTSIYAFVMHAFFANMAAATIGWQASPFQLEVAMADLAIGVIAVLSFYNNYGFRLATVISSTILFWGDAVGHVRQMIIAHNYTIGNAGSWLVMDILIPIILIICIIKLRPGKK